MHAFRILRRCADLCAPPYREAVVRAEWLTPDDAHFPFVVLHIPYTKHARVLEQLQVGDIMHACISERFYLRISPCLLHAVSGMVVSRVVSSSRAQTLMGT
jgi:hypothetical protein